MTFVVLINVFQGDFYEEETKKSLQKILSRD